MVCVTESVVGWPLLSLAGENLARLVRIRQVALSSDREPLDEITEQLSTRPVTPIVSRTVTRPVSSLRRASCG
jgi:hypothetical protein